MAAPRDLFPGFAAGKRLGLLAYSDALTDVIYRIEPADLRALGLSLGASALLDAAAQERLQAALTGREPDSICAGGSPANTLVGFARLGGAGAYLGATGDDRRGEAYRQAMRQAGLELAAPRLAGPSGVCYTFLTPDGERSFAIAPGIAARLSPEDLDYALISEAAVVHTGAYQLRGAAGAALTARVFAEARARGAGLSFDLADAALVEELRPQIEELLAEPVDLIVADRRQARAYFRLPEDAPPELLSERLLALGEVAALTLSGDGSIVRSREGCAAVQALTPRALVDFNGAGDAFAAGLLTGLLGGRGLRESARIGTWLAAKVIGRLGAQWPRSIPNFENSVAAAFRSGRVGSE